MNLNHNDPQHITKKLDRLVRQGELSGIPIADDLTHTIPLANRDFQQLLEDRLVSHLQSQQVNAGDESMTIHTSAPNRVASSKTLAYIPLTLAAALLALVLIGSILFARGGQSPDPNMAAALQSTITPTPEPRTKVVVALQNLPRGFQFPATLDEVASYVDYAPWPVSAVPFNALTESEGGLGQLPGRFLRVDVARDQPIISTSVVNDLTQLDNVGGSPATILPSDRVAVSVPTDLITWEMNTVVHPGDLLDIKATFSYTDADKNFQSPLQPPENTSLNFSDVMPNQSCANENPCSVTQTVIRESLLLHIGPFPDGVSALAINESASDDVDIITVSVTPDEAPLLVWLIEANIPLTMQLAAPPRDFVPVVIAAQPLSWADQVMPGDMIVVYWPPELVPDDAIDDLSLVQGKYLSQRIEQWQPIFGDDLVEVSPYQPGQIPDGMTVTAVIQDWIANDVSGLAAGDNVDITVAFLNSPTEGGCEPCNMLIPENGWMEIKPLLTDVKVFGIQPASGADRGGKLLLMLPIEDVMLLNWLSMAVRPTAITLTPSGQSAAPIEVLPDGRVSLDVPRTHVVNTDETAGLINQGAVAVVATLKFRGFDPSDPMTYALEGSGAATVILAENAEIIETEEGIYTVTVEPEDLPMLQWALAANLPLSIVHMP